MDDPLDTQIFIRCASQTRRALARQASADGRSLSNYVRLILERHVASNVARQRKNRRAKKEKTDRADYHLASVAGKPPIQAAADRVMTIQD